MATDNFRAYLDRTARGLRNAYKRAEEYSGLWVGIEGELKEKYQDVGDLRIAKKDSLELNDAMRSFVFWRDYTMMYAGILQAEDALMRLRALADRIDANAQ